MDYRELLTIGYVADNDTGIYSIGELDYGIKGTCVPWLDSKLGRRVELANELRLLAERCEQGLAPFAPVPKP
jgi:hypothetical protein